MDILKETERVYPKVVEMRRHLHAHPEVAQQEKETSAFVCARLDELGIRYHANVAGYGVVAEIGEGELAIGIRADMDALPVTEETGLPYCSQNPGVMHACGHDMHTACLLGTAEILKGVEGELTKAGRMVKLFFQPAEETIGGAERMIKEGYLENPKVTHMLAYHVDPLYPTGTAVFCYGPMNAETQGFGITVKGFSCHGAHPERGVDAIVMASAIVQALQSISSRFNAPTTPVIVTIGAFHAGNAGNVVAGTAELTGTMRALTPEVMQFNKAKLEQIISGVAAAYGGTAEVHWDSDGYPALINDAEVTHMLEDLAGELLGKDKIAIMPEPSLGGDDFAFFTKETKGCYFDIGTQVPGGPFYMLHNEHFVPDEESMKAAIAMEVGGVLRLVGLY